MNQKSHSDTDKPISPPVVPTALDTYCIEQLQALAQLYTPGLSRRTEPVSESIVPDKRQRAIIQRLELLQKEQKHALSLCNQQSKLGNPGMIYASIRLFCRLETFDQIVECADAISPDDRQSIDALCDALCDDMPGSFVTVMKSYLSNKHPVLSAIAPIVILNTLLPETDSHAPVTVTTIRRKERTPIENTVLESSDQEPIGPPQITHLLQNYRSSPVHLGDGVIVDMIGCGGMALVFKTWCEKLERFHAVKILRPDATRSLRNRFATEAKISGQLNHRSIVDILSVGEWNELPFIEMKYIEGESLDALIVKHTRLPLAVTCAVGIEIAEALTYIHTTRFHITGKAHAGIIHRDLKTANVLISRKGELKVIDFGVARPVSGGMHTTNDTIVGTLQYLTPEQISEEQSIDTRTDIYSLGEILYEMATGEKTFPQVTRTEILAKKNTNSYKKLDEFDFPIDPRLAHIIEKCLERDKEKRFASADDLRKALEKLAKKETQASAHDLLHTFFVNPFSFADAVRPARHSRRVIATIAAVIGVLPVIALLLIHTYQTSLRQTNSSIASALSPLPSDSRTRMTEPPSDSTSTEQPAMVPSTRSTQSADTMVANDTGQTRQLHEKTPQKAVVLKQNKYVKQQSVDSVGADLTQHLNGDPVDLGEKRCKEGDFSGAITALQTVQPTHLCWEQRNLLLLWAYIEMKQFSDAEKLVSVVPRTDGFSFLLLGRMDAVRGLEERADRHFYTALTLPSTIASFQTIQQEVLSQSARVRDTRYRKDPTQQNREAAIAAWENLEELFHTQTSNPLLHLSRKRLQELKTGYQPRNDSIP